LSPIEDARILFPLKTYTFRIQAFNRFGGGPYIWTNPVTIGVGISADSNALTDTPTVSAGRPSRR
jgi:hypothetical protein